MSEQPQSQQNHEYKVPYQDGTARMGEETDVWLKASNLPLKQKTVEQARPKTEAEIIAEKVRRAGTELANLNVVRLHEMRNEDKPFLKESEAA